MDDKLLRYAIQGVLANHPRRKARHLAISLKLDEAVIVPQLAQLVQEGRVAVEDDRYTNIANSFYDQWSKQ
jgi:hypothetical protein